jgi:hypothetical protein
MRRVTLVLDGAYSASDASVTEAWRNRELFRRIAWDDDFLPER